MAIHCVNPNSVEFKSLVEKTKINPIRLAARVAEWQQKNNTDAFPTVAELTIEKPTITIDKQINTDRVLNYIVNNFRFNNKGFIKADSGNALGEIRQLLRKNGLIDLGYNVAVADNNAIYLTKDGTKYTHKVTRESMDLSSDYLVERELVSKAAELLDLQYKLADFINPEIKTGEQMSLIQDMSLGDIDVVLQRAIQQDVLSDAQKNELDQIIYGYLETTTEPTSAGLETWYKQKRLHQDNPPTIQELYQTNNPHSKFDFRTKDHLNKFLSNIIFEHLNKFKNLTFKDVRDGNINAKDILIETLVTYVNYYYYDQGMRDQGKAITTEQYNTLMDEYIENLKQEDSEIWRDFTNYFAIYYDITFENINELLAERGMSEIPHIWEDKNQLKEDRRSSIDSQVKFLLSKVVDGTSEILGLPILVDPDVLLNRLINAHYFDVTNEDFLNTLRDIAQHEYPGLAKIIEQLENKENVDLFNAYKSALNYDLAQNYALVTSRAYGMNVIDFLISNRSSYVWNRNYDVWRQNVNTKLKTGQLKFLVDIIDTAVAKREPSVKKGEKAIDKVDLNDIALAVAGIPLTKSNGAISFAALDKIRTLLVEAGIPISERTLPLQVEKRAKSSGEVAFNKSINSEIFVPVSRVIKELYKFAKQGKTEYISDEKGYLYQIAKLDAKYSPVRTDLSYLNVNNDVVYTPIYQSFIGNKFKGLDSIEGVRKAFEEYTQDDKFQHSNLLWQIFHYTEVETQEGGKTIKRKVIDERNPVNLKFTSELQHKFYNGIKNITDSRGIEYDTMLGYGWDLIQLIAAQDSEMFVPSSDAGRITSLNLPFDVEGALYIDKESESGYNISSESYAFKAVKNTVLQELTDMQRAANRIFDIDGTKLTPKKEFTKTSGLNKLHPVKHWNETSLLDSKGNPTGRVFQFTNLTFVEIVDGKERVVTLNDRLEGEAINIYTIDPSDARLNSIINKFVKDAIIANVLDTINHYTPIKDRLLTYSRYSVIKGTRHKNKEFTEKGVEDNKLFENAEELDLAIGDYFIKNYLAQVEISNFIQGNNTEYKSTSNQNKRLASSIKNGHGGGEGRRFNSLIVKDAIRSSRITELTKVDKAMDSADSITLITLPEFERRLKDKGRYKHYEDVLAVHRDREAKIDQTKYPQMIESQKYFYYDRSVSDNLGHPEVLSTMIKNSTVVLTPNNSKNSQLEQMYQWMLENGIDEIVVKSAAKVSTAPAIEMLDKNGNFVPPSVEAMQNATRSLDASALLVQLDVPSHNLNETVKLPIQLEKLILQNINPEGIYKLINGKGEFTGREFKHHFNNLISANIQEAAISLLNEFGAIENGEIKYATDIDGNTIPHKIDIDKKKTYKFLKDYVEKNEINDSLRKAIDLDTDGNPKIPLYSGLTYNKFSAILHSLFTNRVTHHRIDGMHLALVPELGFQVPNESIQFQKQGDKISFVENGPIQLINSKKKETVNDGKFELKVKERVDADGTKHIIAEVLVPRWDKRFIDVDINNISEEARTIFMAFIPTEGRMSTIAAEVVGFIEDGASQAVLPYELVSRSGKDYDIDTVFVFTKRTVLSDDVYIPVEYMDNTTSARDRYNEYINSTREASLIKAKYANELNKAYGDIRSAHNWYDSRIEAVREVDSKTDIQADTEALTELFKLREQIENEIGVDRTFDDLSKNHYIRVLEDIYQKHLTEITTQINEIINRRGFSKQKLAELHKNKKKLVNKRWQALNKILADRQTELESQISFDKFKERNIEFQNSRVGRQNRIIDALITGAASEAHFAEFFKENTTDNILKAGNFVNSLYGYNVDNLNINNAIDASKLRELNMSTRILKGQAIAFKGILAPLGVEQVQHLPIRYRLDAKDYAELNKKDKRELFDSVEKDGDSYIVTVTHIGNSKTGNWLDIHGEKITDQFSEVVAGILDAVNDPLGFNINTHTLSVFSLMSASSLSHKMLNPDTNKLENNRFIYPYLFTHQPIIVDLVNLINSNRTDNPNYSATYARNELSRDINSQIDGIVLRLLMDEAEVTRNIPAEDFEAIKAVIEVYKEYGYVNSNALSEEYLQAYNKHKSRVNRNHDQYYNDENKYSTLLYNQQELVSFIRHYNETKGRDVELTAETDKAALTYLLAQRNILGQFNTLNNIANSIVLAINTFNTDKLGAGPTFGVTRNLYSNIENLLIDKNKLYSEFSADSPNMDTFSDFTKMEQVGAIEVFFAELDNTEDISEKVSIFREFAENWELDIAKYTPLTVGDKSAVEHFYPVLFNQDNLAKGEYTTFESYLYWSNIAAFEAFSHQFPQEQGIIYRLKKQILNRHNLLNNDYAQNTLNFYINSATLATGYDFLLTTNNPVVQDAIIKNDYGNNASLLERRLLFGPVESDISALNINMDNPSDADFRKFAAQSLVTKIRLLWSSSVVMDLIQSKHWNNAHILDNITLEDDTSTHNKRGYSYFTVNEISRNNIGAVRESITEMYYAKNTPLSDMMRLTIEEMIKSHAFIRGINFGNNITKYVDVDILTSSNNYQPQARVGMGNYTQTLRQLEQQILPDRIKDAFYMAHHDDVSFVPIVKTRTHSPKFKRAVDGIEGAKFDPTNPYHHLIIENGDDVRQSRFANNEFLKIEHNNNRVVYKRVKLNLGDEGLYVYYPVNKTLKHEFLTSGIEANYKYDKDNYIFAEETYQKVIEFFIENSDDMFYVKGSHANPINLQVTTEQKSTTETIKQSHPKTIYQDIENLKEDIGIGKVNKLFVEKTIYDEVEVGRELRIESDGQLTHVTVTNKSKSLLTPIELNVRKGIESLSDNFKSKIAAIESDNVDIVIASQDTKMRAGDPSSFDSAAGYRAIFNRKYKTNYKDNHTILKKPDVKDAAKAAFIAFDKDGTNNEIIRDINTVVKNNPGVTMLIGPDTSVEVINHLMSSNINFTLIDVKGIENNTVGKVASKLGVEASDLNKPIIHFKPKLIHESVDLGFETIHEYDGSTLGIVETLVDSSDMSVYIGDATDTYSKLINKSSRSVVIDLSKSDKQIAQTIQNKIKQLGEVGSIFFTGDEVTTINQEDLNSRISIILRNIKRRNIDKPFSINTINRSGVSNAVRANIANIPVHIYKKATGRDTYNRANVRFSEDIGINDEYLNYKDDFDDIQYMQKEMDKLTLSLRSIAEYATEYRDTSLPYKNELEEAFKDITNTDRMYLVSKMEANAINQAVDIQLKMVESFTKHYAKLYEEVKDINYQNLDRVDGNTRAKIAGKLRNLKHIVYILDQVEEFNTIDANRGPEELINEINEKILAMKEVIADMEDLVTKANNLAKRYIHGLYIINGNKPDYITKLSEIKKQFKYTGEFVGTSDVMVELTPEQEYEQFTKLLTENEAMTWAILNLDSAFNTGISLVDGVMKEYFRQRSNRNEIIRNRMKRIDNLFKEYEGKGVDRSIFESKEAHTARLKAKFLTQHNTLIAPYKWGEFYENMNKAHEEAANINKRITILKEQLAKLNKEFKQLSEAEQTVEKAQYEIERDQLRNAIDLNITQYRDYLDNWYKENTETDSSVISLSAKEQATIESKKSILTNDAFKKYLHKKRIRVDREGEYYKLIPAEKYNDYDYQTLSEKDRAFLEQYTEILQEILDETHPDNDYVDTFFPYAQDPTATQSVGKMVGLKGKNKRVLEKHINEEFRYEMEKPMLSFPKPYYTISYERQHEGETTAEYHQRILKSVNDKFRFAKPFTKFEELEAHNKEMNELNKAAAKERRNVNMLDVITQFAAQSADYRFQRNFENTLMLLMDQLRAKDYKELQTTDKGRRVIDKILSKITDKKEYRRIEGDKTTAYDRMLKFLPAFYGVSNVNNFGEQVMSAVRGYTSMVYMGANYLGGIKNVTKGYIDELMESFAGQYLGREDLKWATAQYMKNVVSMMADVYKNYTDNFIVGVIKSQPDLLELRDSNNQMLSMKTNPHKFLVLLNNAMFSNMNSTEHFMQYTMMLGMMRSHRMILGKPMSYTEFSHDIREKILLEEILTPEQREKYSEYKETIAKIKAKPSEHYDTVRRWVEANNIDREQLKKYSSRIKEVQKTIRENFEKHERLIDQLELIDGEARIKEGSALTIEEYGLFANKAQKVNHTLHGVYNRIDRMALKNYMIADLAFQFRSWMKPNWDRFMGKRWNRSTYSEGLGTYQKGAYISLKDFLFTPLRANRNYTGEERTTLEAFSNLLTHTAYFLRNVKHHYRYLPDYEKAGITRTLVQMSAILMLSAAMAGLGMTRPEDEKEIENALIAFLIYEMNMIHSEHTQFIPPFGWHAFYRRTMYSPLAAEKVVTDMYKLVTGSLKYPFQDDEQRLYQAGPYVGRSRIGVLAGKSLPIYRQVHKQQQLGMYTGWYKLYNPHTWIFEAFGG